MRATLNEVNRARSRKFHPAVIGDWLSNNAISRKSLIFFYVAYQTKFLLTVQSIYVNKWPGLSRPYATPTAYMLISWQINCSCQICNVTQLVHIFAASIFCTDRDVSDFFWGNILYTGKVVKKLVGVEDAPPLRSGVEVGGSYLSSLTFK